MKPLHTPGPWEKQNGDGFEVNSSGTEWSAICACIPNNLGKRAVGLEETEANAYLSAAAPELLAACRSAASWFGELGNDDGAQGLLEDLRAALAKADGRKEWEGKP